MPKYLGKGANFHLIVCELMPSRGEDPKRFHQTVCSRCGFYRDALQRQEEAMKVGKTWRKLVCVHPANKSALEKLKPHVTVWST